MPFSTASRHASKNDDWDSVSGAEPLPESFSHYIVCFDCGKKLPYDWEHMRMVKV